MINFKNIDYLKSGNPRQKLAYKELIDLEIFEILKRYKPILAGTLPIEIDLPESDLDIICHCRNHTEFSEFLTQHYGNQTHFKITSKTYKGIKSTIAKFATENFELEIFGQDKPSAEQNAYQHMLIEYRVLKEKGAAFRAEILKLKAQGLKTEPAFAKLLGLQGNPFDELLKLKSKSVK